MTGTGQARAVAMKLGAHAVDDGQKLLAGVLKGNPKSHPRGPQETQAASSSSFCFWLFFFLCSVGFFFSFIFIQKIFS